MRSPSMASPPSRSFTAAPLDPRVRAAAELLATVLGQDLEQREDDVFESPSSGKTVRRAHSVHSAPIHSA
ncbi:MAG: hypothetical protein ABIP39_05375, partial [Polyangiaceae bacterium]